MNKDKQNIIYSVWKQHENQVFSKRSVKVDPGFVSQMAANLFCPGPSYFYVIDFSGAKMQFDLVSPTAESILGINRKTYTINEMLGRIHPNDIDFVGKCEDKIGDFIRKRIPKDLMTSYKFAYSFRLRHQNGSYIRVLHQALTLSTDGFGRVSKVMSIETRIDHLIKINSYCLSIIGLNGSPSYFGIDVKQDNINYLDSPGSIFTSRELEVIRLLSDGLTANQVADTLHISFGTVRTHRKNILQKSGCPNITAVVAKCVREGLV